MEKGRGLQGFLLGAPPTTAFEAEEFSLVPPGGLVMVLRRYLWLFQRVSTVPSGRHGQEVARICARLVPTVVDGVGWVLPHSGRE